jgi:hypothetical protein
MFAGPVLVASTRLLSIQIAKSRRFGAQIGLSGFKAQDPRITKQVTAGKAEKWKPPD